MLNFTKPKVINTGQDNEIYCIDISNDGKMIAIASSDRTAKLFQLPDKNELFKLEGHTRCCRGVSFSYHSNMIATCSEDSTVRIWNSKTGKQMKMFENFDKPTWVVCVAFCPARPPFQAYQTYIAAAGDQKDPRILIWN